MTRKRAKRKPPKRRSPVATALRSPAFRKRVVPNKKRHEPLPYNVRIAEALRVPVTLDDFL